MWKIKNKQILLGFIFGLMEKIKSEKILLGFIMVSFDEIKPLFTSVWLTETTEVIFDCVGNHKAVSTVLIKDDMKNLLTFYNKNV